MNLAQHPHREIEAAFCKSAYHLGAALPRSRCRVSAPLAACSMRWRAYLGDGLGGDAVPAGGATLSPVPM